VIHAALSLHSHKPSTRHVALVLAVLAGQRGECWPSSTTLSRMTGYQPASVRRLLRDLEHAGLISRTPRTDGAGRSLAPLIRLAFDGGSANG